MKKIKLFQVDAFTDKPFKGNPAAVCLIDEELPDALLQNIAAENNLSETAFVLKQPDGFNLRWFTPTVEIKLCGHATLASAHVLWQEGILNSDAIAKFHTLSGVLTASKNGDWITLDFPSSFGEAISLPPVLATALNSKPLNSVFCTDRYIIELASETEVSACTPDFKQLQNFDTIVITSRADDASPYDFVSRTFAPAHGIDEDPVTGSSHCCLLPYWTKKLGKTTMLAYQASARGGEVKLEFKGDRTLFSGKAVTLIEGHFLLHV